MNEPAFGLAQIGQIAVPVGDIEQAITFYRDVLGMRFLFEATPPGLGFFDVGGVRLMLDAPAKSDSQHCSSIIYYQVPDLEAAFATLSERGVRFETDPHLIAKLPDHKLWMAFFRDPRRQPPRTDDGGARVTGADPIDLLFGGVEKLGPGAN